MEKIYNFYVLFDENDEESIRYVGTTCRKISQRFSQHKYCAMHPEKRGLPVHKWMYSRYKEGINICYKQIDSCEESEWEEREKYWISYYKKLGHNLLNIDSGGRGSITKEKRSEDSIQRSIDGHKKAVIALNKDGSFYKEFSSIKEAVESLSLKSKSSIGNVLKGRAKSAGGYMWVYKDKYTPNSIECYENNNSKRRIKVYSFNLDGTLYKEFPYLRAFDNLEGLSQNGVRSAIKNKNIYHNKYWSLENTINISEYERPHKFEIEYNGEKMYARTLKQVSEMTNLNYTYLSSNLKNGYFEYKNYKILKLN